MYPSLLPVNRSRFKRPSQKDIATYLKDAEEALRVEAVNNVQIGRIIMIRGVEMVPETIDLRKDLVPGDDDWLDEPNQVDSAVSEESNGVHGSVNLFSNDSMAITRPDNEQFLYDINSDLLNISSPTGSLDYLQNSPIPFDDYSSALGSNNSSP